MGEVPDDSPAGRVANRKVAKIANRRSSTMI
jgi:hypothetical protein